MLIFYFKGLIIRYTQKQIDKYNRQKYINTLEKISKNLFKMFRDNKVIAKDFVLKFEALKKQLDNAVVMDLHSHYHKELKSYILRIYRDTCLSDSFEDKDLEDIKEVEMSALNRLQKLKNGVSYKKEKHKAKHHNEDWG